VVGVRTLGGFPVFGIPGAVAAIFLWLSDFDRPGIA
jgi:hypothetical protein